MPREAMAICHTCHHKLDEVTMLKLKSKRPWRAFRQDRLIDPDVGPPDPRNGGLPEGRTLFGHQQMYDFCSERCRDEWIATQ